MMGLRVRGDDIWELSKNKGARDLGRLCMLAIVAQLRGYPAASRIKFATSFGCDTSERWPASSSMVVAFMRLARKRSKSGLMVPSFFDTAYQLGLECHAASVVRPAKIEAAVGHWTA